MGYNIHILTGVGVVLGCVRTLMLDITDHVRANLGKTHFKLKTTKEKE